MMEMAPSSRRAFLTIGLFDHSGRGVSHLSQIGKTRTPHGAVPIVAVLSESRMEV